MIITALVMFPYMACADESGNYDQKKASHRGAEAQGIFTTNIVSSNLRFAIRHKPSRTGDSHFFFMYLISVITFSVRVTTRSTEDASTTALLVSTSAAQS